MRILRFLIVLFFPALLFSQSLRDSKQLFYTISKNELIGNTTNVFTFKLNFEHETPFHCASVAWNENHEREKPNTSFYSPSPKIVLSGLNGNFYFLMSTPLISEISLQLT